MASKYSPVSCTIVGVDLMPIRPIPNVITHTEDITGGKVRQLLLKDLNGLKVRTRGRRLEQACGLPLVRRPIPCVHLELC